MSVVNLSFDTKEKTMTVSIDGKTLDNVRSACFYNTYDENNKFYADITMMSVDEENKMRKVETLYAKDAKNKKKKNKKETEEVDDKNKTKKKWSY